MDVNKELLVCALCGTCREVCPLKRLRGFDTWVPRGKILTTRQQTSGELFSEKLVENWYYCTTCGYCREVCPTNIDLIELFKMMRTDIAQKQMKPLEAYTSVRGVIQKCGNPFNKPMTERNNWIPSEYRSPPKAEYVYMAGCYASYTCPEIATSIVNVLNKSHFSFGLVGPNEPCCEMIVEWGGEKDLFENETKKNVTTIDSIMKQYGAQYLFTSCPGCYTTLKEEYPKIVGKLDYEVLHASELFAQLIDAEKIIFHNKLNTTVTYHDPCHLGRFHGIYEHPRKILESIPGVTFREMDHSRHEANCCGGLLRTSHARHAITQATFRAREASSTGASVLLTFCPLCYTNLRRVARREKLEVLDIPMLMEKAL